MPRFIASSAFGLEGIVKQELRSLGFSPTVVLGGVSFEGDYLSAFKTNLALACADRVQLLMGESNVSSFSELFDFAFSLPWEDLLPKNAAFPVTGQAARSQLMSVRDCQSIVKKAIVERLKTHYRCSWFDESGPIYPIHVALNKDTARLSIDCSGDALNRRGYRTFNGEAPLRETLAAAMVRLCPGILSLPVYDPFCGTGTLLIEAAFYKAGRLPGIYRNFVMEQWVQADKDSFDKLRDEYKAAVNLSKIGEIIGRDCDAEALALARKHLHQAGLSGRIHLEELDIRKSMPPIGAHAFISNPPYGERLLERKDAENLYRALGDQFKQRPSSSLCAITAHPGFERFFGRKASKKRRLYNGRLECEIFIIESSS